MDTIEQARRRMEVADDAFTRAVAFSSSTAATLDVLAQNVADTEAAYERAVDFWERAAV